MTLVWEKSRNKRTAMLLLLAIADHAHDDGKGAYPGIDSLARKTRQTDRNVQLLLKTLADSKELIIREGEGPHGTNLYEINVSLLRSYPDWDQNDADDETERTDVQGENFSPPAPTAENFTGENSRAKDAENFTPGVKNSAQLNLEIPENKLENEGVSREFSPKPLTVNKNKIESSDLSGKTKEQIWDLILNDLKETIARATFDTWIRETTAREWDIGDARLVVEVRNENALQWLDLRLRHIIERSATYVNGGRGLKIMFVVREIR